MMTCLWFATGSKSLKYANRASNDILSENVASHFKPRIETLDSLATAKTLLTSYTYYTMHAGIVHIVPSCFRSFSIFGNRLG